MYMYITHKKLLKDTQEFRSK